MKRISSNLLQNYANTPEKCQIGKYISRLFKNKDLIKYGHLKLWQNRSVLATIASEDRKGMKKAGIIRMIRQKNAEDTLGRTTRIKTKENGENEYKKEF